MNEYFDASELALAPHTLARAASINAIGSAVEAAFDRLPAAADIRAATASLVIATGDANTIIATVPNLPALTQGTFLRIKVAFANTGPVAINVNGFGGVAMLDAIGRTLVEGDLRAGALVDVVYDGGVFRAMFGTGALSAGMVSTALGYTPVRPNTGVSFSSLTVQSAFNVGGTSGFNGNVTIGGNLGLVGDFTLGGLFGFGPDGGITGNVSVSGSGGYGVDLSVGRNFGVVQNISVGGLVTVAGSVSASTFITTSDARLKTHRQRLDGKEMMTALKAIGGERYLKNDTPEIGVIAQDVQAAGMPELVFPDEKGMLGVNYFGLVTSLIAALCYVNSRVDALQADA